jgi:hypothetical protein
MSKVQPGPYKALQHFSDEKRDGAIVVDAQGWNVASLWKNVADHGRSIEEIDATAELLAASYTLSNALYYMGGGSVYLEDFGRLCFCARHGRGGPEEHATTCNDAYEAWKKAGSIVPDAG